MHHGEVRQMKRLTAATACGLFGVIGLFVAAGAASDGGYVLGLLLFAASLLSNFWMMKQHFDGVPEEETFDIWPEKPRNGWLLLVVLGILGIVGLFLAAGGDSYFYWFGVFLFVVCCVMGLATMKTIYDRKEQGGHHLS